MINKFANHKQKQTTTLMLGRDGGAAAADDVDAASLLLSLATACVSIAATLGVDDADDSYSNNNKQPQTGMF